MSTAPDSALRPDAGPESSNPSGDGVDKNGSRVREMFRQIAPRYDAMNHLLSLNIDKRWRQSTVKRLKISGTTPILDVCSGTGDLALAIARHAGPDVRVMGSDFCNAMLQIADQKKLKGSPAEQAVGFLEADSQALPFPDNHFQCVTVAFGLRNVADTDQGIREMTRVCTPGGQVVVLEFSQPQFPVLKQGYAFYFRHVLPRVGQLIASNEQSAYNYLPESVSQFPCGQALADRMTANGLVDVKFTPLTVGVATIYEGTKPAAGAPTGQHRAPAASQPQGESS